MTLAPLQRWLGVAAAMATGAALAHAASADAQTCQARSPDQQVLLVELYTSEGCNACPPADRWLSTLKGRPQVLAAAFHVDYWDRLGWTDRFGDARHTERQAEVARQGGARFSYTPQVLVNGRDWRAWPTLPMVAAPAAVQLTLARGEGPRVDVQVTPLRAAPARLALWWAVLEDGHVSHVKAGENLGVTLLHDHVVRHYGRLPAWAASAGVPQVQQLNAAHNGEGGRKVRLLVVVTDAVTGAPLQAAQLVC
jgi:hypothetical protein